MRKFVIQNLEYSQPGAHRKNSTLATKNIIYKTLKIPICKL